MVAIADERSLDTQPREPAFILRSYGAQARPAQVNGRACMTSIYKDVGHQLHSIAAFCDAFLGRGVEDQYDRLTNA